MFSLFDVTGEGYRFLHRDGPKLQGSLICLHVILTYLPWGWAWVGMEIFRDHTHTQYSSLGSGISGEFYLTFLCASRYAGICLSYAPSVRGFHSGPLAKLFVLSPALLVTALLVFKAPHFVFIKLRLTKFTGCSLIALYL